MSTYELGQICTATVKGKPDVRIAYADADDRELPWVTLDGRCNWPAPKDIADIRPLVVLDLDPVFGRTVAVAMRGAVIKGESPLLKGIADQIEEQTKPPRIPEPGRWGIVRDDQGHEWVRVGVTDISTYEWLSTSARGRCDWDEIQNPVLIRDGIEDAS